MKRKLRILLVEDQPGDAQDALQALRDSGMECIPQWVNTRSKFEFSLTHFGPDVVVAQAALSYMDGRDALHLTAEKSPGTPLIFVAGRVEISWVVDALRMGAADVVATSELERLALAVRRARAESKTRAICEQLPPSLLVTQRQYQNLVELFPGPIVVSSEGIIRFVNPAAARLYGAGAPDTLIGRSCLDLVPEAYRAVVSRRLEHAQRHQQLQPAMEQIHLRLDGAHVDTEVVSSPFVYGDRPAVLTAVRDITEQVRRRTELHAQRQRLELYVRQAPLVSIEWNLKGEIVEWNAAAERVFGYPRAEALGQHVSLVVPANDPKRVTALARRMVRRRRVVTRLQANVTRSGERILCEWVNGPLVNERDEVVGIASLAQEVTERERQAQRIARLTRIRNVLSAVNAMIVRQHDRRELLRGAARVAVEQGGFQTVWIAEVDPATQVATPIVWQGIDEGYMRHVRVSLHAEAAEADRPANRALRNRMTVVCNDIVSDPSMQAVAAEALQRNYRSVIALPLVVEDNAVAVMAMYASEVGFFDDDEVRLLSVMAADLSFALRYIDKQQQVYHLAYYDVLTGLANRKLLQDRLLQAVNAAKRQSESFAIALVDVQRLGYVNDAHGYAAGDAVIRTLAERLSAQLEPGDSLARFKDDQFVLLLPRMTDEAEVARYLAARIWPRLGQPIEVPGALLRVVCKAGVAFYPCDSEDAEGLLVNATAALAVAKRVGMSDFSFYAPEMNARVARELTLENRLRTALDREQFLLHYQPKIDLRTGKITGLEALIRWQDPESGLVSPGEFIPLLEETGLIVEVGRWALRRVVADHGAWRKKGLPPVRIAVNVSPIQLRQPAFMEEMDRLVGSHGSTGYKPPIDVEITESTLMQDVDGNSRKLKLLRSHGIRVAMDDFGTGYSSLKYFAELPIDIVKIDRSFVQKMIDSDTHRVIVASVIGLARRLGLTTVAEGVETEAERDLLKSLRCDEMQGFLYSRPLPVDEIEALLAEGL